MCVSDTAENGSGQTGQSRSTGGEGEPGPGAGARWCRGRGIRAGHGGVGVSARPSDLCD